MTPSLRRAAVLGALVVALSISAAMPVRALDVSHEPVVVELFTSQGCSSCPPADALLGELARVPGVVALAFHVDYWDSIGWRDQFSTAGATQRQNRYVETLGLRSAFTPQVVINGRSSFVGSDGARIKAALSERSDTIPLRVEVAGGELAVTLPERQDRGSYDVNLVAYLPEAATPVGRGENSGRTLREFNIVRQLRSLGVWSGKRSVFRATLDSFPPDATRAAVLLQRSQQGPIAGSATVVLR